MWVSRRWGESCVVTWVSSGVIPVRAGDREEESLFGWRNSVCLWYSQHHMSETSSQSTIRSNIKTVYIQSSQRIKVCSVSDIFIYTNVLVKCVQGLIISNCGVDAQTTSDIFRFSSRWMTSVEWFEAQQECHQKHHHHHPPLPRCWELLLRDWVSDLWGRSR